MTDLDLDDLEGSLSYALLLQLHRTGALSDQTFRMALRTFAVDFLEWLLELESIDAEQLRAAYSEVLARGRTQRACSSEAN